MPEEATLAVTMLEDEMLEIRELDVPRVGEVAVDDAVGRRSVTTDDI